MVTSLKSTDPDPKSDPDPEPSKTDPDPEPKTDPDPEPSIPKGKTLVDEDEYNRMRREISEADKAKRERERKEAEKAGEHDKVVEAAEEERDEEKSKREQLEAELENTRKGSTVTTVASRLNFVDPADALLHLPSDTPNDEAAIERALKKLAKEKPYLAGGQGSRTGAAGGGSDPQSKDIYSEIRKAEEDGDVATSTRLKRQKFQEQQSS